MEISHEEFITILNEKDKYEKMKESIKTIKSSDELNTEEGKKIKQQNYKKQENMKSNSLNIRS